MPKMKTHRGAAKRFQRPVPVRLKETMAIPATFSKRNPLSVNVTCARALSWLRAMQSVSKSLSKEIGGQ